MTKHKRKWFNKFVYIAGVSIPGTYIGMYIIRKRKMSYEKIKDAVRESLIKHQQTENFALLYLSKLEK